MTTVWLGANDLLKYIFSHGNSPATDSPQQFTADLTQIVTTLQKAGSKVVLGNLPDILGNGAGEPPVPQFFPIAKVGADLTAITGGHISAPAAAQIQGYLQATYTGAGGFLTESGFFSVLSQLESNPAALPNLDPAGTGSGDGALYLDTAFAAQAIGRNAAYNAAIDSIAASTGAALADVQTGLQNINAAGGVTLAPGVTLTTQFGGGLVSYDGLHPSNVLYALIANVFGRSFQQLLPAFVAVGLQGTARDLSFLMTSAGVGALTGAFATASLGNIRRRGVVFAISGVGMGGLLALFGVQTSLVPASVLVFGLAACSQSFITMATALYNTHTPDELRGRVMGLATVIVQGGISMGSLVVGSLGAAIGIGAALVAGGAVTASSAAVMLARVRALRDERAADDIVNVAATAAIRVAAQR